MDCVEVCVCRPRLTSIYLCCSASLPPENDFMLRKCLLGPCQVPSSAEHYSGSPGSPRMGEHACLRSDEGATHSRQGSWWRIVREKSDLNNKRLSCIPAMTPGTAQHRKVQRASEWSVNLSTYRTSVRPRVAG